MLVVTTAFFAIIISQLMMQTHTHTLTHTPKKEAGEAEGRKPKEGKQKEVKKERKGVRQY